MTTTDPALRARVEAAITSLDAVVEMVEFGGDIPTEITIVQNDLRSALAAAEAAPLDVERLARAWWTCINEPEEGPWEDASVSGRANARQWSRELIREYAALQSPDTRIRCSIPACNGLHDPDHHHVSRSPDTETAGEAGWPKDGYDHDAPSPGYIETGSTEGGRGSE